jgi:hypothetical protein
MTSICSLPNDSKQMLGQLHRSGAQRPSCLRRMRREGLRPILLSGVRRRSRRPKRLQNVMAITDVLALFWQSHHN